MAGIAAGCAVTGIAEHVAAGGGVAGVAEAVGAAEVVAAGADRPLTVETRDPGKPGPFCCTVAVSLPPVPFLGRNTLF
jgi:hypothetical protein